MAMAHRLSLPIEHCFFTSPSSPSHRPTILVQLPSRVSTATRNRRNPSILAPIRSSSSEFGSLGSIEFKEEEKMSEGFFEAIEELEKMAREPADILEEMNDRLSARELQLVMVYFSQEGRDSWFALEVFDWLRRGNRIDEETTELMVSIMCGWLEKLIRGDGDVGDVVQLLKDMECVGLKPAFSMIEKVISLYWEMGRKAEAVVFVKEFLHWRVDYTMEDGASDRGGPIGYLAWKMMVDGDYRGAVKLVIQFKECGLRPEVYSYLIAMTALVKEQNELSKALRKLKGFTKASLMAELDVENIGLIEKYQSDLLMNGVRLSGWAIQEGSPTILGVIHERLLALYTCAGQGVEAERQLWQMKLAGKEPDRELYDIVLAICASQNEVGAVRRLLACIEATSSVPRKKTLTWLLRGYIKGRHFEDASETLMKMLDLGLCPEYLDRTAVLQGLRKSIQQSGNVEPYLKLCKRLSDADLIGPCLVYLYLNSYKLWMVRLL
eukprot:TRINITY_DN11002_c0_g1_i1.p1 TRINITY_DN11002_c0_g1~~TRINITY_DN11002_c0_g1_i1.p1  ORF type:complete len:494 (+),score=76.78 TRINITY_DN11002_c0_g1_i1:236-1717(+)